MDTFLDSVSAFGKRLTASGRIVYALVALFLFATGLGVAGSLIKIRLISISLGGLAGLIWFIVGYIVFSEVLSDDLRDKFDLRENWEIGTRRWGSCSALIVWLLFLEFVGNSLPKAIIGALNVTVLLILWRLVSATEFERNLATQEEEAAKLWEQAVLEENSDEE